MTALYERLGGSEGITAIASDLVDLHLINPRISPLFASRDVAGLKQCSGYVFYYRIRRASCIQGKGHAFHPPGYEH